MKYCYIKVVHVFFRKVNGCNIFVGCIHSCHAYRFCVASEIVESEFVVRQNQHIEGLASSPTTNLAFSLTLSASKLNP